MRLTSTSFENNGFIPKKHTGFGEDVSPELILEDIPEGTKSLAVILDDMDVPFHKRFTHWIMWGIEPINRIPKGIGRGKVIHFPIDAVQGKAWGKHMYRGPKQPSFIRKTHRYLFTAYALDCKLNIQPESNKSALIKAMNNHVLSKAEVLGKYFPG